MSSARVNPLVSIVTVVFNGKEFLERTILSVIRQDYTDIEYIVIDGASSDGTLGIIRQYEKNITYWVSEKDRGIYDAMNKGIKASNGDYLWFLNAGDEIYGPDTVRKIVSGRGSPDVYYGETMLVDASGNELGTRSEMSRNKLPETLSWKDMARGMVVCHQSFIVKRSIVPFYDLSYPHTSDIDWVIKCLKKAHDIVNTRLVLSRYLVGGYSKKNHLKAMVDRYAVYKKHFGFIANIINHAVIIKDLLGRKLTGKSSY